MRRQINRDGSQGRRRNQRHTSQKQPMTRLTQKRSGALMVAIATRETHRVPQLYPPSG